MELLVEHQKNNDTIKILKCGAEFSFYEMYEYMLETYKRTVCIYSMAVSLKNDLACGFIKGFNL
jgi:hypothetical protein